MEEVRCEQILQVREEGQKYPLEELRVVEWNIERGYLLDQLIEELGSLQADLVLLQEVDHQNKRTNNKDVGREIALGLKLPYFAYGVEFEEIESPKRSAIRQGGGTHGNAIISRYPILESHIIRLPQAWDWSKSSSQPRRGGRMALACVVQVGNERVGCVSVHLENWCGAHQRRAQFRCMIEQLDLINFPSQRIIGGDMNTIIGTFGIAYGLNPFSWQDIYERLKSIWYPEAQRWEMEMKDLIGKEPGTLSDPFDKRYDGTIYQLFGWYQPKLDWLLYHLQDHPITKKSIGGRTTGPIGQRLSDHKWLFVAFHWSVGD